MMCHKDVSHAALMWPSLFQLITFTCPILLQIKWQIRQQRGMYFPKVIYNMTSMLQLQSSLNTFSTWNTIIIKYRKQRVLQTKRVSKLQKWWVMMLQETNKERGFLLGIVALWLISRRDFKRSFFKEASLCSDHKTGNFLHPTTAEKSNLLTQSQVLKHKGLTWHC